jgi:Nif-specific regulatory protein
MTESHQRASQSSAYKDIALAGVYEISKILTRPQPLERSLGAVIGVLSSFMQMRRGSILALDAHGEPEIAASTGATIQGGAKTLLPQKVIDHIVATGMPLVIENLAAHPYFTGSAYRYMLPAMTTVSFIGVPIKVDGQSRGTLSVDREWNGGMDFRLEDDVRLLTMVANLVGQAMRMHELVARDRDRLIGEQHRLEKALSEAKSVAAAEPRRRPRAKSNAILGDSPLMQVLMSRVEAAARSNATVLIRGETGTGKELIARAIHDNSPRREGPFVKVNCAALPESLIESELFGHEKGSFTGAIGQRVGRFEMADRGTLFLDEIGEISAAFQAKLLRVLQEGELERVGGTKTIKVDVRIVCATNRNLEEAVASGAFRADLYYRINVVTLLTPPLRERPGDIPLLARKFLDQFAQENGRDLNFGSKALELLEKCAFPGNVRELENCVRRTAALAMGADIQAADLACSQGNCLSATLWKGHATPFVATPNAASAGPRPSPEDELPIYNPRAAHPNDCPAPDACPVGKPVKSEREILIEALEKTGWVQAKAARLLGLTPRQIGYALRKQNIDIKQL